MLNTLKNATWSQLHIEQSWNYSFLLQNLYSLTHFSLETKKGNLLTMQTKVRFKPILEYGDVVWDIYLCSVRKKKKKKRIRKDET